MKNRRKLKKLPCIIVAMLIILILSVFIFDFPAAATGDAERKLIPVYVVSGDTLWNIVEEYYQYKGDIRKAIYEVQQINNLENSCLQAGQIVYIPLE